MVKQSGSGGPGLARTLSPVSPRCDTGSRSTRSGVDLSPVEAGIRAGAPGGASRGWRREGRGPGIGHREARTRPARSVPRGSCAGTGAPLAAARTQRRARRSSGRALGGHRRWGRPALGTRARSARALALPGAAAQPRPVASGISHSPAHGGIHRSPPGGAPARALTPIPRPWHCPALPTVSAKGQDGLRVLSILHLPYADKGCRLYLFLALFSTDLLIRPYCN